MWRERETPDYLPLEKTFDGTLAKIGNAHQKKYALLSQTCRGGTGLRFSSARCRSAKREFLDFNRECMYAAPGKVAVVAL